MKRQQKTIYYLLVLKCFQSLNIFNIFSNKNICLWVTKRKTKMLCDFSIKLKLESRISKWIFIDAEALNSIENEPIKFYFLSMCQYIYLWYWAKKERKQANENKYKHTQKKNTTKQMRSITMSNEYTFDLWFVIFWFIHSSQSTQLIWYFLHILYL